MLSFSRHAKKLPECILLNVNGCEDWESKYQVAYKGLKYATENCSIEIITEPGELVNA
jgi:hypothetical protein